MSSPITHSQKYTAAGVVANLQKVGGFPPLRSQAAVRAALRHRKFGDGREDDTRHHIVGLHPLYFTFRDPAGLTGDPDAGDKLLRDTLIDAFDAVSENPSSILKLMGEHSDYNS
jgi:hypothetical protein